MATLDRNGSSLKLTTTATAAGTVAGDVGAKREREQEIRDEECGGSDELTEESIVVALMCSGDCGSSTVRFETQ